MLGAGLKEGAFAEKIRCRRNIFIAIPLAPSSEWIRVIRLVPKGLSLRLSAVNPWQHRVNESRRKQLNALSSPGLVKPRERLTSMSGYSYAVEYFSYKHSFLILSPQNNLQRV